MKKLTMFILEIIFFSSIYIISTKPFDMPIWLILLTFLAVMRVARTISENEIMEWLREPFTETLPDACGAGQGVIPKGTGFVRAIGGLLSCPICTGTWSALVLVAIYTIVPSFGKVLIIILALAGGSEMIYSIGEFLSWGGRLFRVACGYISPDDKEDVCE